MIGRQPSSKAAVHTSARPTLRLALASTADRPAIFRLRHDVYATELGQYDQREDGELPDRDDLHCRYVGAWLGDELVGFVAVTPPTSPTYSVDRYLSRSEVRHPFDDTLFEIRALTVRSDRRGILVAPALMYAAFRYIEACGGTQIIAIGRSAVLDMYLRLGMRRDGPTLTAGGVPYELISASVEQIEAAINVYALRIERMEGALDWQLPIAFHSPSECYHGGAFFTAVGERFDALERVDQVISADVLDAWFDPAPAVIDALMRDPTWLVKTSPPAHAGGLVQAIAEARGVPARAILPGAGSSDLIFLALRHWLTPESRVLVLDPTYGEYLHVLQNVVGCDVERFTLSRDDHYLVDVDALRARLRSGFDMFIWVNPNSPTGRHVPRRDVERVIADAPAHTRIWIDETYMEYVGSHESIETVAAGRDNVVVCKSMSKVYALSGARVAYLCAPPAQLEELRHLSPPWAVSLPAQIAAVRALESSDYYQRQWAATHGLREVLVQGLRALDVDDVVPSVANFVLVHLPDRMGSAASVVERCRSRDLFMRDASSMGSADDPQALRIAVKDERTTRRMLEILAQVIDDGE